MKKITDYLQELGLSEIEAILYEGLLETGPTTVMDLAQHVGLKRITSHFHIENLIAKGLVTQTVQGSRRQIVAEKPERLNYLIEEKLENVKRMENKFPDFLSTVKSLNSSTSNNNEVEVKYYEGKKAVLLLYSQTLSYNRGYSFADLDRYYEIFPNTNNMWNKAYLDNQNREVWDIVVDSPLARKIVKITSMRYHVKFISRKSFQQKFQFSDYLVFDNKVAIIQLETDNVNATLIESANIALTLTAIHRTMWELLPKINEL